MCRETILDDVLGFRRQMVELIYLSHHEFDEILVLHYSGQLG